MKKISFRLLAALAVVAALAAPSFAYEAFKGPLGVLQKNEGVTDGYVLLVPFMSKVSYLIDNDGKIINEWVSEYKGFYGELLPNGNFARHGMLPGAAPANDFGGGCGIIEEFDWSGKKVWEHIFYTPGKEVSHHTFEVMPNGNYLVLGWEYKSTQEAVAMGMDPNGAGIPPGRGGRLVNETGIKGENAMLSGIWPDFIREIDHQGKTVWEWHVWDHLGTGKDQIDINVFLPPYFGVFYAGPDWTHFNGLAYNPRTDEICVTSRNFGEVYVINKTSGKITYRWGNPAMYGEGRWPEGYSDDGDQKLFGPHAPDWTMDDTITVLDNGTKRPSGTATRAVELDPKTGKVVWEWGFRSVAAQGGFYSPYQCGAQKLPNGNWMITSTSDGHVVEVLPTKEIVWEFVNTVARDDKIYETSSAHGNGNGIHKALRYGTDWPGFQGKDMKARGQMANWVDALSRNPAPSRPMPGR